MRGLSRSPEPLIRRAELTVGAQGKAALDTAGRCCGPARRCHFPHPARTQTSSTRDVLPFSSSRGVVLGRFSCNPVHERRIPPD